MLGVGQRRGVESEAGGWRVRQGGDGDWRVRQRGGVGQGVMEIGE